ncbi:TIGR01621 family pseudouridine synthase [Gilvimarinus sp. 1_MG-2023]|uniref:TIGR01621 family pseudouridine synthase n=1 Tax=Gilvimarinus sp. 1_MG-2023 TaxID=3062638 RepID=UPI0026E3FCFF|nr:TIGR01621 family pseudouridine synthase [Gilvimarinus sp. 1_MG-2023]MDO6747155.1 TIGR01621 family pseudouridine synthase [Gilvimarinus sp. 1_MG-2023]
MFDVIWQNADALVVHKHAGVDFHTDAGAPGLFQQVKRQLNLAELYPVHRLDKVTSGLVLMAKTQTANRELCQQFAAGEVEKFYLALSAKKPAKKQGRVVGDMAPARRSAWKLLRSQENPARTAFISQAVSPGVRLQLVKPKTGKTHQIRVALKSVGAPILGDTLYGGAPADRVYLHAYQLAIVLKGQHYRWQSMPQTGELFLQAEFLQCMQALGSLDDLSWPGV